MWVYIMCGKSGEVCPFLKGATNITTSFAQVKRTSPCSRSPMYISRPTRPHISLFGPWALSTFSPSQCLPLKHIIDAHEERARRAGDVRVVLVKRSPGAGPLSGTGSRLAPPRSVEDHPGPLYRPGLVSNHALFCL